MLFKKKDATKKSNSAGCTVWEYPECSKHVSIATSLITGRYPEKGMASNTEVEEKYYVLSGTGIVHSEKGDFSIVEGDVYHFDVGEKFYVDANKLRLVVINSPPWYPEQYKLYK